MNKRLKKAERVIKMAFSQEDQKFAGAGMYPDLVATGVVSRFWQKYG